jgi:diacylglycerol kinase (ATP)
MDNHSEIWFIVNLFSGSKSAGKKESLIAEINAKPNCKIIYTEFAGHAKEIAQKAIDCNINRVVAVGGDGTLNEIGSILRGSNTQMGIVPMGSGNGLARHLKIPLNPIDAAIRAINGHQLEIDTCTINDIPFFCTAGVGFDAYVAENFSKKKNRGFLTYIITSIQSFFSFKTVEMKIESKTYIPFAMTFANASQYGNEAIVAPESKIDDGLIDMVILKPFSIVLSLIIVWRLFNGTFSKSKYVETIKGERFSVFANSNLLIHFDGEPKLLNTNELIVEIDPRKLKVIV